MCPEKSEPVHIGVGVNMDSVHSMRGKQGVYLDCKEFCVALNSPDLGEQ